MSGTPLFYYFWAFVGFGFYEISVRWLDQEEPPHVEHGRLKYGLILLFYGLFSTFIPANFGFLFFKATGSTQLSNILTCFGGLALPLAGRQAWASAAKLWMEFFASAFTLRQKIEKNVKLVSKEKKGADTDVESQSIEETINIPMPKTSNTRGLLRSYFGLKGR